MPAVFAGAGLAASLIGASPAAADDSWKLTVNNTGNIPLKVVILDSSFKDITGDRSSEFISRGSGQVTVKKKGAFHWEVFAKGDREPCQKQRNVSSTSISVSCDRSKADERAAAGAKTASANAQQPAGASQTQGSGQSSGGSPQSSGGQQTGGSQGSGQQANLRLGGGTSGCSLTNITSKGCPPKIMQEMEDLKKKGDEALKELDKIEAEAKGLDAKDPKSKAKLDELVERWRKAKATVDVVTSTLGRGAGAGTGQPAENITYKVKLEKKEEDLGKQLKDKARAILGCVPSFDMKILSCQRETDLGGGRK